MKSWDPKKGYQRPQMEEGQTKQYPKERGFNDLIYCI
jgi:hypothetical protein